MSTRTRQNSSPPKQEHSAKDLPPPRTRKGLKSVSKPLSNTRLTDIIYILAGISILITGFYAYRITQWKSEAGGWWNLAVGKRPPQVPRGVNVGQAGVRPEYGGYTGNTRGKSDVEDRINALAEILGLPATDLASAISGAVAMHVAPATLSSISSSVSADKAKKTAVEALVGDEDTNGGGGVVSGMADTMGKIVGMDEPLEVD